MKDGTQQRINPLPAGDVLRALMVAMDLWATKGIRTAAEPLPDRTGSHARLAEAQQFS